VSPCSYSPLTRNNSDITLSRAERRVKKKCLKKELALLLDINSVQVNSKTIIETVGALKIEIAQRKFEGKLI
jgi:hypothetical protein